MKYFDFDLNYGNDDDESRSFLEFMQDIVAQGKEKYPKPEDEKEYDYNFFIWAYLRHNMYNWANLIAESDYDKFKLLRGLGVLLIKVKEYVLSEIPVEEALSKAFWEIDDNMNGNDE